MLRLGPHKKNHPLFYFFDQLNIQAIFDCSIIFYTIFDYYSTVINLLYFITEKTAIILFSITAVSIYCL